MGHAAAEPSFHDNGCSLPLSLLAEYDAVELEMGERISQEEQGTAISKQLGRAEW